MTEETEETMTQVPGLAVGAILLRQTGAHTEVLLGRRLAPAHGAGTYGALGGRLHFGERLDDALRREVREECGIEIVRFHIRCFVNMVAYGTHWFGPVVMVPEWTGSPVHCEPDRVERWDWYSLHELPTPLFAPVRVALKRDTELIEEVCADDPVQIGGGGQHG